MWMEQQELFPAARADMHEVQVEAAPVAEPEQVVVEQRQVAHVEAVRHVAAVREEEETEIETVQLTETYRKRDRGVRLDVIAKFLQVNRAVDGVDGMSRFALPRRQFAAKCSLWKGSSIGTPFLTGC